MGSPCKAEFNRFQSNWKTRIIGYISPCQEFLLFRCFSEVLLSKGPNYTHVLTFCPIYSATTKLPLGGAQVLRDFETEQNKILLYA